MSRLNGCSLATIALVVAGCATPLELVEMHQMGRPATGYGWTVEPADAFGGYYYGPIDGPKRYQPPNSALRSRCATEVHP